MNAPTRIPAVCLLLLLATCGGGAMTSIGPAGADLSAFQTLRITVGGVEFEVWLADTPAKQQQGLMNATPAQLAPLFGGTPRGMIFAFPSDETVGFVMNDTYIPLDLAYFRSDGLLVETYDLTPLDPNPVNSGQPVRYALEVNAGDLAAHGIAIGDSLSLPLPPP